MTFYDFSAKLEKYALDAWGEPPVSVRMGSPKSGGLRFVMKSRMGDLMVCHADFTSNCIFFTLL